MVKKIFIYLTVFLVSLVLFLALLAPASFVWERLLAPNVPLRALGLKVHQVQGSLWRGQSLVEYQDIESIVDWDLQLSGLVGLTLPLRLQVDSHLGAATGNVELGLNEVALNISSLEADLSRLNKVISRQRIKLDGVVIGKGISAVVADGKIISGSGDFSWSGGNISYPVQRETHDRQVPSFKGQISTRDDGMIYMGLRDAGSRFDLIEGSLLPDGVALLQVKRRLLDLVDEPWSPNSEEQDVVFKVKKSIY